MPAEARYDISVRRAATIVVGRLRTLRSEAGFTLIEMVLATMMLMIISAPIAAVLSQGAAISKLARERTGADQLAQAQIDWVRTLPYSWVGLTNRNPPGKIPSSPVSTTLPSGEAVTMTWTVTYVSDAIPGHAVTNADYKKVVLTITRNSDNRQLTQKTTYVAAASAPPYAGSKWLQIQRTVVDAVNASALSGANINLTGGPSSENRNDTSDAAGNVLFPGLDSSSNSLPVYLLVTTLGGYYVFPDDLAPGAASQVGAVAGLNSSAVMRMYKPVSLTVNLQNSAGAAWTTGATVTLDGSRCGKQTITVASGSSSTTITQCDWANGKTVNLVPNVTGLTPAFDKYYVTMNSGANWGATSSSGVVVPSSYPTTLTQTLNLKMSATTYATANNKTITVTVKNGGVADGNARVEVTGGAASIYLFGVTNGSGQVSFTVPTTSTAATYTINANDMGVQKGTTTTSVSSSTTSPINVTVNIS